jgi:hypothetical protein
MAILEIKRAAERHLNSMTPALPTGWENVNFDPPENQMYQRVQFIIQTPEDPVFGTGFHRERVTMQIFVVGAINKGTSEVLSRAALIRDRFKKGLVLVEDEIKIHVLRTAQISGTSITSDRVICPVIIELVAEVYSD